MHGCCGPSTRAMIHVALNVWPLRPCGPDQFGRRNYFCDQLLLSGLFRATGPQLKRGPRGPQTWPSWPAEWPSCRASVVVALEGGLCGPQSGPLAGPRLLWPLIHGLCGPMALFYFTVSYGGNSKGKSNNIINFRILLTCRTICN